MILLAAYTISAIGSNLPATLILYYVQYVLGSGQADLFLLLYFVTGVLLLPVWVRLAHRFGKKETWVASMAVNTGAFIGVFFLGPGDTLIYGVLVILSGVGFGATLALPSAIQADVIDYDELKTGRRREGQYIGCGRSPKNWPLPSASELDWLFWVPSVTPRMPTRAKAFV
jgi:GPH family glycoside/pentoside/hexuronide:cation symporter